MRRKQLLKYSLVGLFAAFLWQGVAIAQAPPGPGAAKQVNLSAADQLNQADTFLSHMDGVRNTIRRELNDARQQRDVVKTLCLNDKLNQVDVAITKATERRKSLELAAKANDQELANHEYTILSVLHQRVQQLDGEAKQCIGKEVGFVGESSTTMDVDPNLPAEDPSEYPTTAVVVQPPQCASCFK